jgi:hypothetical protein
VVGQPALEEVRGPDRQGTKQNIMSNCIAAAAAAAVNAVRVVGIGDGRKV